MRKKKVVLLLAMGLILCGCGQEGQSGARGDAALVPGENGVEENGISKASQDTAGTGAGQSKISEGASVGQPGTSTGMASGQPETSTGAASGQPDASTGTATGQSAAPASTLTTQVAQEGPYGEISLTLPAGWDYELCPMESEALISGDYGIHFFPAGAEKGFIELAYFESFGVCGMGLSEEKKTIAGAEATVGTFDENPYWDFVRFTGTNENVIALSYWVEDWWEEYGEAATAILDTLRFDPDTKEDSAYSF